MAKDASVVGEGRAALQSARTGSFAHAITSLRRAGLGKPLLALVAIGLALALWWLIAELRVWEPIFVPSPGAVWDQAVRTSTTHDGNRGYRGVLLYEHLWASLRRVLLAVAISVLLGTLLGIAISASRWTRALFQPPLDFVRSLPPLAYFSLLVIWFGIGETSKVVLLVLAALPAVVVAVSAAAQQVNADRLYSARSLGASRAQLICHVTLPSILPDLMTGLRISTAFAFTTMVAAETINGLPGIGGMVRDAQRFNQTDVVVLGIIVIGICGVALDAVIRLLDRLLVPWRGHA